jgi:hypothetical protein
MCSKRIAIKVHVMDPFEGWTELQVEDDVHSEEWLHVLPAEEWLHDFDAASNSSDDYDEWSLPTSNGSGDDYDEWSLPTSNGSGDDYEWPLPMYDDNAKSLWSDSIEDGDEFNSDLYLHDLQCRRKPRYGKRQLKHSLVRRSVYYMYSFGGLSRNDDQIEVISRPVDERGYSDKTAIDELLPELLVRPWAVLHRKRRWQEVNTLLDQLVDEGAAERVAVNRILTSFYRFGHCSAAPHHVVRYIVQPNGDKFKNQVYARCYGRKCKLQAEKGVEYVLYIAKEDKDDGGVRRRYSCKKKNWPKEYYGKWDKWHVRSFKRAELKKEIQDALK